MWAVETIHPGAVVGQNQESKEKTVVGMEWGVPSVPPDIVTFCCGAMSSPHILNLHLTSGYHGGILPMRSWNITACLFHLEFVRWLDVEPVGLQRYSCFGSENVKASPVRFFWPVAILCPPPPGPPQPFLLRTWSSALYILSTGHVWLLST